MNNRSPNTILDPRNEIRLYSLIIYCVIFVVMQKIKIASVAFGVVLEWSEFGDLNLRPLYETINDANMDRTLVF
jgi:hypothetical protein